MKELEKFSFTFVADGNKDVLKALSEVRGGFTDLEKRVATARINIGTQSAKIMANLARIARANVAANTSRGKMSALAAAQAAGIKINPSEILPTIRPILDDPNGGKVPKPDEIDKTNKKLNDQIPIWKALSFGVGTAMKAFIGVGSAAMAVRFLARGAINAAESGTSASAQAGVTDLTPRRLEALNKTFGAYGAKEGTGTKFANMSAALRSAVMMGDFENPLYDLATKVGIPGLFKNGKTPSTDVLLETISSRIKDASDSVLQQFVKNGFDPDMLFALRQKDFSSTRGQVEGMMPNDSFYAESVLKNLEFEKAKANVESQFQQVVIKFLPIITDYLNSFASGVKEIRQGVPELLKTSGKYSFGYYGGYVPNTQSSTQQVQSSTPINIETLTISNPVGGAKQLQYELIHNSEVIPLLQTPFSAANQSL